MMKLTVAAAAAAIAFAGAAQAGTLTTTTGIDPTFVQKNVAQIRGGGGSYELAVLNASDSVLDQADVTWPDNSGVAFTIDYDAATTTLSLSALGGSVSDSSISLAGSNAMAIFARTEKNDPNQPNKSGTFSVTGMLLNGMAIADILPPPAGVNPFAATVTGFDFGSDFTLTGTALFDFTGNGSQVQSNLAASFKFGTADVAPVPLPAAGLLLLGALGGLGLAKRRRKAA